MRAAGTGPCWSFIYLLAANILHGDVPSRQFLETAMYNGEEEEEENRFLDTVRERRRRKKVSGYWSRADN